MKIPREFTGRPDSSLGMEDYVPTDQNLIGVPEFSELDGSGKMVKIRGVIRRLDVSMIVSL